MRTQDAYSGMKVENVLGAGRDDDGDPGLRFRRRALDRPFRVRV